MCFLVKDICEGCGQKLVLHRSNDLLAGLLPQNIILWIFNPTNNTTLTWQLFISVLYHFSLLSRFSAEKLWYSCLNTGDKFLADSRSCRNDDSMIGGGGGGGIAGGRSTPSDNRYPVHLCEDGIALAGEKDLVGEAVEEGQGTYAGDRKLD